MDSFIQGFMSSPALENAVRVGAAVPSQAQALLVVGARHGAVLDLAWVPAACVFGGVRKGAGAPVVRVALGAAQHLEGVEFFIF